MLAALGIDPLGFLRSEDDLEVASLQAIAEGANEWLNKRDTALAKAIGHYVGMEISKRMRVKKQRGRRR